VRLCLVLTAIVAGLSLAPVASATASEYRTGAKQAILIDAETGAVLFQHNADVLTPPASMAKLATVAVVFRALKEGRLKLTDTFLVSEHAWRTGGAPSGTSAMFAPLNSQVTVEDLLKGMIIQSGNDAAIVVAEGMAGSEAAFAKMMTEEARAIGLEKSTFANPTGLPHPDQLMTVREIAQLSRFLIETYPEYYHWFGERAFPYQPAGRNRPYAFYNRNPLLSLDIGADGLKTGHLESIGYGLAGSAVQDGKRLIAVVHGLPSSEARRTEAQKLLTWGFRNFAKYKLFGEGEIVGSARVWGGDRYYLPLTGNGVIGVILPKTEADSRLRAEIVYTGPLKPPIRKGDRVAVLRVTSPSNTVNEVPLYAAEDVEQASVIWRGLDSLALMAFRWIADQASDLINRT
jgi:D-alanyl-D-alanine carboxypeptidase (penicillin-binding protein 5/6)